jgi:esterase
MAQFPAAQAKTLEGCGHWLHAQKPVIFNRIVSEFIDKHSM